MYFLCVAPISIFCVAESRSRCSVSIHAGTVGSVWVWPDKVRPSLHYVLHFASTSSQYPSSLSFASFPPLLTISRSAVLNEIVRDIASDPDMSWTSACANYLVKILGETAAVRYGYAARAASSPSHWTSVSLRFKDVKQLERYRPAVS